MVKQKTNRFFWFSIEFFIFQEEINSKKTDRNIWVERKQQFVCYDSSDYLLSISYSFRSVGTATNGIFHYTCICISVNIKKVHSTLYFPEFWIEFNFMTKLISQRVTNLLVFDDKGTLKFSCSTHSVFLSLLSAIDVMTFSCHFTSSRSFCGTTQTVRWWWKCSFK